MIRWTQNSVALIYLLLVDLYSLPLDSSILVQNIARRVRLIHRIQPCTAAARALALNSLTCRRVLVTVLAGHYQPPIDRDASSTESQAAKHV
jgi:hypothetical protein